jgi:hypothetical protein
MSKHAHLLHYATLLPTNVTRCHSVCGSQIEDTACGGSTQENVNCVNGFFPVSFVMCQLKAASGPGSITRSVRGVGPWPPSWWRGGVRLEGGWPPVWRKHYTKERYGG